MITTVLFDLDGTLLKVSQEEFINVYFGKLKKVFERLGIDPDLAIKAVWAGTKAMMQNDGTRLNCEAFWDTFAELLKLDGEMRKTVEANCDAFYTGEFDSVREIMGHTDVPGRLIPALRDKGYIVVLATNPLFPECAVTTRLRWLGLELDDFVLVTHYANSRFCKPNPEYFREILGKINKKPQECIMVGNNVIEDMSAEKIGIDTYIVTENMENEKNLDISAYKNGTLEEMEEYLLSLK